MDMVDDAIMIFLIEIKTAILLTDIECQRNFAISLFQT